jgi:hypothetical protein
MPVEPVKPPPTIYSAVKILISAIIYKVFPKYYNKRMAISESTKTASK